MPAPGNSLWLCRRWNAPKSRCESIMSKPTPLSLTKIRDSPSTASWPMVILAGLLEQRLAQPVKGHEGRAKVVRNGIAECLELPVDRGERDRALLDESLELRAVTAKLLLRAVELDEHGHLGAQNGWDDGREHEIDGTQVVAASHIGLGLVERSYEDERRELRTGALSDQLRRF